MQLPYPCHSTFLRAVACTFSVTRAARFYNTTTSASTPPLPPTSYLLPIPTMSLLPPPEAIYPDPATAFTAIQGHARQHSYAVFQRDKRSFKMVYSCDRAGQYDPKGKRSQVDPSKQRKNTGSKKCGCLMKVVLHRDNVSGMWQLEYFMQHIITPLLQLLQPILHTD
jgi:hypothetical protein